MFSYAESDPVITKEQFKRDEAMLRTALLKAQYARLASGERSLLLVIAGIDGAGKGAAVNLLSEWMDPRHIRTMAFDEERDKHHREPDFHRYWINLPENGKCGVVFGSWYWPLMRSIYAKNRDGSRIQAQAQAIRKFEATLSANGVQVVKLWFHLSKQAQAARTKRLLSNPDTAWQVMPDDKRVVTKFERLRRAGEEALRLTDCSHAPWTVIPSACEETRSVATARVVLAALKQRRTSRIEVAAADQSQAPPAIVDHLRQLGMPPELDPGTYDEAMMVLRRRLAQALRDKGFAKRSLVLVFEGQDAAGKGGAIRRVTEALDVRQYEIVQIAAPAPYELTRPYLWRFWRRIPSAGRTTIFDRSWYGRVLVERVEKLISRSAWERAYAEINDFEAQLVAHKTIVLKFWLAIDSDVQLERFKARERSPFKQFKITDEDWRNRAKWNQYAQAANAMLSLTDTPHAPWHVINANDKRHARLQTLEHIVNALEARL